MEKWKIVGFKVVNGKNKDGKEYSGYRLFLAREPLNNSGIAGLEVGAQYIGKQYIGDFVPRENMMINICYNRFGRVESVFEVV